LYLNHVSPKCHLTLYYLKEEKMSSYTLLETMDLSIVLASKT